MSFPESTHAQYWIFSEEELNKIRVVTNQKQLANSNPESSLKDEQDQSKKRLAGDTLSIEEEAVLKRHYELKIIEVCNRLAFPPKVSSTAVHYFKRYYLYESVLSQELKMMALACIYLATKVEEHNIDVVQFADKLKQKAEDIVKLELPLLQSIRFHLIIYHPYRPLEGFLSQLQERGVNIPFDQITCHSKELIQGVLTTDAPLLFPPSQIALAVLKKLANNPEVDKYIAEIAAGRTDVTAGVAKCDKYLKEGMKPIDTEFVRNVDRKLRFIKNPELKNKRPKTDAGKT